MATRIRLATGSPTPLFAQIVHQVRQAVAVGALKAGEQLPTVRELAAELVLNPNTVAKAYQELERDGVLVTRRGAGTFVAEANCVLAPQERERLLAGKVDECLTEAVHLGFGRRHVTAVFTKGLGKYQWPEER